MNILSFIAFAVLLGILCFALAKLGQHLSIDLKLLFLYLIVCSDVILVLEIASLLAGFNNVTVILLIQAVLSGIALVVNKIFHLGFVRFRKVAISSFFLNVGKAIKNNRLLSLFGVVVSLNYAFLLYCSIHFPQNITDSLYNHLSRIGHWLQQGSLAHYRGFNIVGMIYPYNNGLLVSLPIIMLKTNIFAGIPQFCAAIICAVSVYSIAKNIGFSKKAGVFSGLLALTYPVILYQSITAQNDLLAASFIAASIAFLVAYLRTSRFLTMVLSLLALAIALGTKQYALLIFPGYGILALYGLIRFKKLTLLYGVKLLLLFLAFFLCFGSYSYVQNMLISGSPFGVKGMIAQGTNVSARRDLPKVIWLNSSRIFSQFISCDGLPPTLASGCLSAKESLLRPILPENIESDLYISGPDPFILARNNISNAEVAFYGPISWLLILPSIVFIVIYSVRKRSIQNLLIMLVPLLFFYLVPVIRPGWSLYEGRLYMSAVVLLQPLTAWMFESKKWPGRVFNALIGVSSAGIMIYATLNNASLPLTSKNLFTRLEQWGKVNSVLVQKIAYKLKPFAIADMDVWVMSPIKVMTLSSHEYYQPVQMVERLVPEDANLGIMTDFAGFPDYLFMGHSVSRGITRIFPDEDLPSQPAMDYVLLAPEYEQVAISGYDVIGRIDGWTILMKETTP